MPDFNFLTNIKSKLQSLFNPIASSVGQIVQPLKVKKPNVVSPVPDEIPQPTPTPTQQPIPEPTVAPGSDTAVNYMASQMPPSSSQTPQQYYPVLGDQGFMNAVSEADKIRQGLTGLLILQALFESTGGRSSSNIFGTLPQGENAQFETPTDALNYQLGPSVLGGGANSNMNILNENTPLTEEAIRTLYSSYNPNSSYFEQLLKVLLPQNETQR